MLLTFYQYNTSNIIKMLIDDLSKSVDSNIKLEYDKLYGTYEWDIPIVNRKHIFSDVYYNNLIVKYFDESESEYVILMGVYYKKDTCSDEAWLFVSNERHTKMHSFDACKSNNECSDEITIFKKIKRIIDSDIEEQRVKNALYVQDKIEKRIELLNPQVWGAVAFVVSWIICRLLGK